MFFSFQQDDVSRESAVGGHREVARVKLFQREEGPHHRGDWIRGKSFGMFSFTFFVFRF